MAAESRGDVAAALTLYSDDAIVQNGGLCAGPLVSARPRSRKSWSAAWRLSNPVQQAAVTQRESTASDCDDCRPFSPNSFLTGVLP
jgi:hypothetical protein